MLGYVDVGADEEHPEGRLDGVRGPDLLTVDHDLVTVDVAGGAQARQVGAGPRLREELAPGLLPGQHRREVPGLLLLGAVDDDRRPGHPDRLGERTLGQVVALLLLGEDRREVARQPATTVLLRPGQPGPAVVVLGALPGPGPGVVVGLLLGGAGPGPVALSQIGLVRFASRVGAEERVALGAPRGLFGGVVEVHRAGVSSARRGPAAGDVRRPRSDGRARRPRPRSSADRRPTRWGPSASRRTR